MSRKDLFVSKFLSRLDRLDRPSIEQYVLGLKSERDFLEEILHEIPEAVMVINSQGQVVFWNLRLEQWFDVNRQREKALPLSEVIRDSRLAMILRQHLRSGKEREVHELEILQPREKLLRVSLSRLREPRDSELLVCLTDITAEGASQLWHEKMARIESLVQLAAGVAHEIGNPLNAVMIHLQLLKKELRDLPRKTREIFEEKINILNNETSRLDRTVRNFLKAARQSPLRLQTEDLNTVVESAIHVMNPELQSHRIKVIFQPDKTLPSFLLDRERLHASFLNLIKNAMEAMPKGGALKISISHHESVVSVEFKDQGKGVEEKDLAHIFDAYFTTKKGGSGLGLTTVYSAVRDHSGRIEVSSKPGKGSTFLLLLPLRKPKLQLPRYEMR